MKPRSPDVPGCGPTLARILRYRAVGQNLCAQDCVQQSSWPDSLFFMNLLTFKKCLMSCAALGVAVVGFAASDAVPNPVYRQRAEKIVGTLGVTDTAKITRVTDAIAAHYAGTNAVHDATAVRVKALKQAQTPGAAASVDESAIKAVRAEAEPKLAALHTEFLGKLSADLTPAQIEQVKDGLTYGVLPLTFRVYQQMLPDLTAAQKAQLLAWLTEAREHAMDAGSSDEKHAWFGKYKGKINNYLAAAGYDMKKAEKNLSTKRP